jgi:hypothetical protein
LAQEFEEFPVMETPLYQPDIAPETSCCD